MIKIEVDLPHDQPTQYQGIEFIARPSDSYNPQETANKLAEFLDFLYRQLPFAVVEELQKNPRIDQFRKCLTNRL